MQSKKAVGLRQIADELGVSKSLVSKVLSGRLGTSGALPATIDAIRGKAEELNYKKNNLAEALRAGRQNAIGVFVHRHGVGGSTIVDEMVSGIATEASSSHQRLSITYFDGVDDFRQKSGDAPPTAVRPASSSAAVGCRP